MACLFSSGLVAGEAIMGILIAVLMLFQLKIPFLTDWPQSTGWADWASLAALMAMVLLLIRVSLRRR